MRSTQSLFQQFGRGGAVEDQAAEEFEAGVAQQGAQGGGVGSRAEAALPRHQDHLFVRLQRQVHQVLQRKDDQAPACPLGRGGGRRGQTGRGIARVCPASPGVLAGALRPGRRPYQEADPLRVCRLLHLPATAGSRVGSPKSGLRGPKSGGQCSRFKVQAAVSPCRSGLPVAVPVRRVCAGAAGHRLCRSPPAQGRQGRDDPQARRRCRTNPRPGGEPVPGQ